MRKICFLLLFLNLFDTVFMTEETFAQEKKCLTRYPVVLVHGIGYRDDIAVKKYWGDIPEELEKEGAVVFLANQDAIGSIQSNAMQLKIKIDEILLQTGAEKVNIIAHSKGGLDSRYMISKLGMDRKVASLTTLATPHRGSILADIALESIDKISATDVVKGISTFYAKLLGDKNPNPLMAYQQLTVEYMDIFNKEILDSPEVYYQSYGGSISPDYPRIHSRAKFQLINKKYGPNDGVVPVSSFKWGIFKGIVGENTELGVSHFEIIGFANIAEFDVNKFYINLVNDLKTKGF